MVSFVELSKLNASTLYEEDVRFGTHLDIWGSWYNKESNSWGYGCCHSLKKKQRRCTKSTPYKEGEEEEEDELEVKVSRRMAELLERCPGFSAEVPTPEQEKDWSDVELQNFVHSNGLIRPARTRGEQKGEPTAADWKVLEVEKGADSATLKKAYRRLALQHHPDKHQGEKAKAKAGDMFKKVVAAYEAISGNLAEVPAMPAAAEGVKQRRWRMVIVD
ncbi:unnamed protein product [Polarella glacialis]|uniref:J domain-containing protein n=1 Tax=Polarella glacialis TaxID=89957 RepID=A0A813LEK1_POLGL|nr:unnamed protein product [Polarella glacialis]CAE8725680.1 unnamed protein product [Polarella glacialis]|mmetsp:Transcript_1229/g.1957  ORF Transcript_1229/g.1957 Transcript_1229/m.1957 type:complete len:218 (+) Transcript_1229:67-720(+)